VSGPGSVPCSLTRWPRTFVSRARPVAVRRHRFTLRLRAGHSRTARPRRQPSHPPRPSEKRHRPS
jgi:hypothetical protein